MIDQYLEEHPWVAKEWSASRARSQKAASKLGLRIKHHRNRSDPSDNELEPESEDSTAQHEEEEIELELISPASEESTEVASPIQKRYVKEPGPTRRQGKRQQDYNEFPDFRLGDDSAPPQWAKRGHTSGSRQSSKAKLAPKMRMENSAYSRRSRSQGARGAADEITEQNELNSGHRGSKFITSFLAAENDHVSY